MDNQNVLIILVIAVVAVIFFMHCNRQNKSYYSGDKELKIVNEVGKVALRRTKVIRTRRGRRHKVMTSICVKGHGQEEDDDENGVHGECMDSGDSVKLSYLVPDDAQTVTLEAGGSTINNYGVAKKFDMSDLKSASGIRISGDGPSLIA